MKKIGFKLMMMLMGILAMSIAFTACSDDDDDDEITKANIVGKWTIEKTVVDGVESAGVEDEDCSSQRDYMEFLANGRWKDIYFDENCQQHFDNKDGENSWKLEGNTFRLVESYIDKKYKDVSETIYTVKKLDAKNMVLHIEKELENGKDYDGEDKDDDVTFYLTRL